MSLGEKLREIFYDKRRIMTMIEYFRYPLHVYTPSDFEFLDEEMLVKTEYFMPIEIKKILKAKEEMAKSLKNKLGEIFGNISPEKRERIENYFNEVEVFTTENLVAFVLANVTKSSNILSDLDVEKIKFFIWKNYPEKFKEIKEKDHNNKRDKEFKDDVKVEVFRE